MLLHGNSYIGLGCMWRFIVPHLYTHGMSCMFLSPKKSTWMNIDAVSHSLWIHFFFFGNTHRFFGNLGRNQNCLQHIEFLFRFHRILIRSWSIAVFSWMLRNSFFVSSHNQFWLTVFYHLSHVFYSTQCLHRSHFYSDLFHNAAVKIMALKRQTFNKSSVADENWLRQVQTTLPGLFIFSMYWFIFSTGFFWDHAQ